MPILLYGLENWILTECLLKKLESFQGELEKWILKWPKRHTIYCCYDLSRFPSMRFRILVSKLGFVVRLLKKGDDDLGGSVVLALCNDFGESCLVRECRELEDVFGTNFTGQILSECIGDVRQIKAAIIRGGGAGGAGGANAPPKYRLGGPCPPKVQIGGALPPQSEDGYCYLMCNNIQQLLSKCQCQRCVVYLPYGIQHKPSS